MPEDTESLDTSESTETPSAPAPDTGGGETQQEQRPGETPAPSGDWRSERYGADWQNSIQYWQDTNKYLRGELDKAKKSRPQRTVEDADAPQQKAEPAETKPESPYSNIQTFDDMFTHVDQRVQRMLSEREQQANFRTSIAATREKEQGDPKRGIPSFSDLEQEILIPTVERAPGIMQLLKSVDSNGKPVFSNPGQALYTLGFLLKYNTLDALESLFAGRAREDLVDKIDEVSRQAVRVRGGRDGATNARLTPADIQNMSSQEFEKLVAKNTGRMP